MASISSFIGEHTAEYVLVPQLVRMLERHHNKVIPLFYWATREGGNMARASLIGKSYKVIALYPRRPKVKRIDQNTIFVKINDMIIQRTLQFRDVGVGAFCGVPLINNLNQLKLSSPCLWLDVIGCLEQQNIEIDVNEEAVVFGSAIAINEAQIINLVASVCKEKSGEDILEIMRAAKGSFDDYFRGLHNDLYKPVYILIN